MSDADGCASGWVNPACYFCAVWVPRRGGGVAVAMVRCWSADRCPGCTVGHPNLHEMSIFFSCISMHHIVYSFTACGPYQRLPRSLSHGPDRKSDLPAEYSRLPRRPADCDDAFISPSSGPHVRSARP